MQLRRQHISRRDRAPQSPRLQVARLRARLRDLAVAYLRGSDAGLRRSAERMLAAIAQRESQEVAA